MLNLRWSWHAETLELFADDRSRGLGAVRTGTGGAAGRGLPGAAGQPGRRRAVPAAARRRSRGPARVHLRPALVPGRRPARGAAGRRVLLARVRAHRGAAAVLRRPGHPRWRPPEGRQRPGRPADRRGPALPAWLLHPVPVGRGLAGGTLPGQRPEWPATGAAARTDGGAPVRVAVALPATARSSPRRSGSRGSAGCRCCCSTPTSRRTTRRCARSPTVSTAAAASTGSARNCCSASAGYGRSARSARSRRIPSPRFSTPTRGTPASSASSASGSTSGRA